MSPCNKRVGDVFINIPQSLGGVYLTPVISTRYPTVSVNPAAVNPVSYYGYNTICPLPAVSPCASGKTLNAGCSPPQRFSCQTQCQTYAAPAFGPGGIRETPCPYPASVNCSQLNDPPDHVGCSFVFPAPGLVGCEYPCPSPPTAQTVATFAPLTGRIPTLSVNSAQIATGSIASYGCCPPSASSLAPRGPTADYTFT